MAPTAKSVSDPSSPDYDPHSPVYDVTLDTSSKYYVGPLAGGTPSGDELRAQAVAQVDQEIKDGWFGQAVDPAVRFQKIQEVYDRRLAEAQHGLDHGLSLRQPGAAPKTLWANATHEQMNEAISQNANSVTMAETSEEWVRVGNELAVHQHNLARAIDASTSNWQGSAGDVVREHLAGVGRWLGATAQGATLAGRQQEVHSQTLSETQMRMAANPPVAFSAQEANARLQTITDPAQYAVQAQQDLQTYRAQQAAREHAAQIMTQFDDTIGAAATMPNFPAPPKLPGASGGGGSGAQPLMARTQGTPAQPVTADAPALNTGSPDGAPGAPGGAPGAPGSTPGAPGDVPGIPDGSSGSGTPGGSPTGGPGSGPGGSGQGFTPQPLNLPDGPSGHGLGQTGAPSVPPLDDTTSTSGFTPTSPSGTPQVPSLNVPGIPGGGGDTVRSGGGQFGPGITPPPFDPTSGISGTSTGGPGGSGKVPTIGRGGGINGDIASRLGGLGGGTGPGGTGLGGATANRTGALGGGLSGSAAAEAEQLAARNAAASAAGRGTTGSPMGGMGGAGAHGKKGEEDKEHKSPVYVENDDPELFAADEIVAPPVIGDWTNQDWK